MTAETLASFRNRAGWGLTPLAQAEKAVQNTLFSVTARHVGCEVGIGRLIGDGALIWYLQDLIVLPPYQGNGIGSGIIEKLILYVRENSIPGPLSQLHCSQQRERGILSKI